ncbi:cilia- and flagella-associated protein 70 [Hyla sarda]|uniref:cilia- and flagella-associated protein 70 n=1 Tax=Hyla sarda TaxID=327740 RepID=UPI0024C30DC4|nr:cilia- and flagella-associated protein 70 [Hyla sarda]XP_056392451.1 cilia- and flagella-associated protein 70 [Hyla sarda]XP_056392452.1 cilia- and flagella-associated protein 70 [Hyla sarda]
METAMEDVKTRPPAPVHITVLRAHDLKGVKGDVPVTYVRSEFNNILLGDSPKLETTPSKPTEYNFTSSFDIGGESPHGLDDVAHKPVLLTVIEILPKEKKQKEEKTSVLGQCAVDLLPLLRGECNFKVTVPLHPIHGSPLETVPPEAKPSLEVALSAPMPLLAESQISHGNLLRVTMEAAYCAPDSWSPTGPPYNYVTSLQMPSAGEKDSTLIFSNGVLKGGGEGEPVSRQKRWPMSGILAPGAQHIPESFILSGAYEEEDGEMNKREDKDFRIEVETHRKRVTWDTERRLYLDQSAANSLQKRIAECRYWPVEVMRAPFSPAGKSKPGKAEKQGDEDPQISFHGVAYVNMVPLLYPGVKRLRGAYKILAYQDAEVLEKTKRDHSVLRDFVRQNSLMSKLTAAPIGLNSPHVKPSPSRLAKDEKGAKEKEGGRRMSAVLRSSEVADIDPAVRNQTPSVNVEGQQYVDSGTYLVLELTLEKPLVPKRMAEEMALKVKELVPVRPQIGRRSAGAQKAVADYHSQVSSITSAILDEYCQLFGQQETNAVDVDPQVLEEQKCQLNYELNCSGKYFAFKEQLKHSVVKIVREKYLRTTAFQDRDQLQAFLSELYIYLVDQMHISLNKTLFDDREEVLTDPMTDTDQLLRFAKEAEMSEDYNLAEMYYQERLARDRQRVDHWLDYGCFKLLVGDYIKAQECFHEALVLNREHLHSLLLCGIVAVLMDSNEEAELFFEDATCVAPGSALAWTILGLFYEIQGNDIRMEMAFSEAGKLHQAALTADRPADQSDSMLDGGKTRYGETTDNVSKGGTEVIDGNVRTSPPGRPASGELSLGSRPPGEKTPVAVPKSASSVVSKSKAGTQRGVEPSADPNSSPAASSIYMEAAIFLAQVNATQFVQRALSHELLSPDGGPSCKYHLMCAQVNLLRKEFDAANENLQEASQVDHQNPDVWALIGHLRYMSGKKGEARQCYEHALSLVADASELHSVYLRLGSIYLQEGEFEKAKKTYLLACKRSPTCLTWLGVGVACYRLEEMQEAEDALSEANALNNSNAEVWGYLTLVCLKTGRQLEAEQSYKYTRKLNVQDQTLMTEIHQLQEEVGFGDPSF